MQGGGDDISQPTAFLHVPSSDALDGALDEIESKQRVAALELDGQRFGVTFEYRVARGIQIVFRDGVAGIRERATDLAVLAGVGTLKRRHNYQERWTPAYRCMPRLPPRRKQTISADRLAARSQEKAGPQVRLAFQRQEARLAPQRVEFGVV
jgi:hypothetical protein